MIRTTSLLVLATSLAAQTTTLPPGFDSVEAPDYSFYMGGYADQRVQVCTSMFTGNVLWMQSLELRQDGSIFSSTTSVARSWSGVTVQVADSTYASLGTTFSSNISGTPTTVFSGSVNWGALTSKSPTSPAAWGTGGRQFGFAKPHLYTGVNDLLVDFTFTGGTLGNGGTWGTSRKTYYLDGKTYKVFDASTGYLFGNYPCISPLSTLSYPDQHVLWAYTYGKSNGTAYDDKIRYNLAHQYSIPNKAHIGAVGLNGVTTAAAGVSLGGCNPLMVTPVAVYGFTTDSRGYWTSPSAAIAFNPSYVGLNVWAQAAHDASGTIHLSRVSRAQIKPQPAAPKDYAMVHRGNTSSTTGVLTQSGVPVLLVK